MFRGPKVLKTHHRLNGSAMPVERKVILVTDALIHYRTLISQLHIHMPLPMELTLYQLVPDKTTVEAESTMLMWRMPGSSRQNFCSSAI
jgi:hypothetical protein